MLNIFRYNPTKHERPHYEIYTVPWRHGLSIIDALNYVQDHIDNSLSFRQSCRSAICGSCAIRVDKRGCLACNTMITEQMSNIIIDPLNHFRNTGESSNDVCPISFENKRLFGFLDKIEKSYQKDDKCKK